MNKLQPCNKQNKLSLKLHSTNIQKFKMAPNTLTFTLSKQLMCTKNFVPELRFLFCSFSLYVTMRRMLLYGQICSLF